MSFHVERMWQPTPTISASRILLAYNGQGCLWTTKGLFIMWTTSQCRGYLFIQEASDWRKPYLNSLLHKVQPLNCFDAITFKRKSQRFFAEEGQPFRRSFNQAPLRCLAGDKITKLLKEVHGGLWRILNKWSILVTIGHFKSNCCFPSNFSYRYILPVHNYSFIILWKIWYMKGVLYFRLNQWKSIVN